MRRTLFTTTAFSLIAGMAAQGAAVAQSIAGADDSRDVIVVTAQKRAQDIQDVPLAITAFSQEGLDRFGIQQFDDLADFVPGLEVQEQSANNPGFVIRGITSDGGEATVEPRIAIFQDGVPISRSRASFVELFDSQVDVVRGPRTKLLGRTALIGEDNVTSIKPELDEFSGKVRAGLGNEEFLFLDGAVNIPLGEKAAARFTGRYKERDGYIENLLGDDLNGFQTLAVRGSLRYQPIDSVDINLIVNYQNDDNPGTAFKSGTFLPSTVEGEVAPDASIDAWEAASLSTLPNGAGPNNGQELGLERDVFSVTALVDWEINDVFTLSSVTNYRDYDSAEVFDADGFALPFLAFAENAMGEQFFQELRLGFEGANRFSGFVGVSYYDEEGQQNVPLFYNEVVAIPAFLGSLYSDIPGAVQTAPALSSLPTSVFGRELGFFAEEFTNFSEATSYDIFGDVTVEITDRFDITGGIRYTYDEKSAGYTAGILGGVEPAFPASGPTVPGTASAFSIVTGAQPDDDPATPEVETACDQGVPGTVPAGLSLGCLVYAQNVPTFSDEEFDGITYRLAVQYDLTNDITMFANYGRGRRPEVFAYEVEASDGGIFPERFAVVEAEETDAYDIGLRGSLFDGLLSGEMVGYYYKYTNFQTEEIRGTSRVPVNAGNASGTGFETALQIDPAPWVNYFFTYAYNGVTFDDEGDDGEPQLRAGNRFRLAPEHALTAAAEFIWECGCGTLSFVPSYSYRSEIFFDDNNDIAYDPDRPRNEQLQVPQEATGNLFGDRFQDEVEEGYSVVDLRVTYTPAADDSWEVEAFVENVFDEEYILDAGNTGDTFGIPTFIGGVPRMYGVYVSKSF